MNKYLILILAFVLIALRWIFPEADPAWWFNVEDLHDETWWAENARRKIIFNAWMWDEYAGALASGPLTTIWHWVNFKLWGINYFSLRLISLIPSTLLLLLLWFKNPISNDERKFGFYLLASSTAFFALNRVGYIESMLMLIMLASISLIRLQKNWSSILAGMLFCVGLLFKGSFIFILMPLVLWLWLDFKIRKQIIISISTSAILSIVLLVVYFMPNHLLFKPYLDAFSRDYIAANLLYDPRGWIARLAWLPSKSWVSSPLACWLSSYILIKISKGNLPSFKSSAWGLFVLIIAFTLLTDFSDRRLSVLLLLLPFIAIENFNVKTNVYQNLLLGFILTLPIFPWLGIAAPAGSFGDLISLSSKTGLLIFLLQLIAYYIMRALKVQHASLFILRSGVLIWVFAALHYSTINLIELFSFNYWALMAIQVFLCLIILIAEYQIFSIKSMQLNFKVLLISFQLVLLLSVIVFPSYTLRSTSQQVSKFVRKGERIVGPNNSIELAFLSQGKTYMYTPSSITEPNVYVGYFLKNERDTSIASSKNVMLTPKKELRFSLFPLLNNYKCEALIVYSTQFFDKN